MSKKIISLILILGLTAIISGCKLIKSPNNQNRGEDSASSEIQVKNPSDHIFDVNLERIKKDLNGKKLGDDGQNWELKSADILETEFGGSNLAQNKMESLYYMLLTKSGTEKKYESAVYFNYNWVNNDWVLEGTKQAYIERLEGENNKLTREVREQKITDYQNRPPEVPTPEIPPVPEAPVEAEETPAVENENVETENTEEAPANTDEVPAE